MRLKGFAPILILLLLLPLFVWAVVNSKVFFFEKASGGGLDSIPDTGITKKVFLLTFDPILENKGSIPLSEYMHWSSSDGITDQLINAFPQMSHGYVSYTISERQEVDGYFVKQSGYEFTDESYISCLEGAGPCNGELIDYQRLFNDFAICSKNVDEVWIWGGPWFGYLEYNPVNYCGGRTSFVMGFNYERQFAEALHDFGHRMEYVGNLRVGNGNWQQNELNEWNKFSLINGHCGNVHYPPGSTVPTDEYRYDRSTQIVTDCPSYDNYGSGSFTNVTLNCSTWGCSQEGYLHWWLSRIPHNSGVSVVATNGVTKAIYNNWWKYYAFFDETVQPLPISTSTPSPTVSPTQSTKPIRTQTPRVTRKPRPTNQAPNDSN